MKELSPTVNSTYFTMSTVEKEKKDLYMDNETMKVDSFKQLENIFDDSAEDHVVHEIDTLQSCPPWKQGAEACIYQTIFAGKICIVKQRLKKRYRHHTLDKHLINQRMRAEVKMMNKCRQVGIRTPLIYFVDNQSNRIFMEFIKPSITMNDYIILLLKLGKNDIVIKTVEHKIERFAVELAKIIYKMHINNIIHGDLTSSNILVKDFKSGDDIILIDFGLSCSQTLDEDKGVDLFVLERSFKSQHPELEDFSFFDYFYKTYAAQGKHSTKVLLKLEEARSRGRKLCMIG